MRNTNTLGIMAIILAISLIGTFIVKLFDSVIGPERTFIGTIIIVLIVSFLLILKQIRK